MQNNLFLQRVFFCLTVILLSGCTRSFAPKGWLPDVEQMPSRGLGAWISVDRIEGDEIQVYSGELLVLTDDSIFVLVDSALIIIPVKEAQRARLIAYRPESNAVVNNSFGGFFLSLTNGWFFPLTGGMWVVGGTIVGVKESRRSIHEYPREPLRELRIFARFPAGMPARLDRAHVFKK